MASMTGLGKGLDALIRETGAPRADTPGPQRVLLKDIQPNPKQPRRHFSEKALQELADSIASQGLLQPILVRPLGEAYPGKYEIVAGERRWRASKMAGLTEVPVVARTFSAQETLLAALIENLQREDLNPVEEALGLESLKNDFGLSQEEVAQRLGKSRPAVANSLRLLTLPEHYRKDIAEGRLSAGHARALLSVGEEHAREDLRARILEQHLSVRDAEGLAAIWKVSGSFASEDGSLAAQETAKPASRAKTAKERALSPQSARMLDLQSRLASVSNLSVKVTGKPEKGRISLAYSNDTELQTILAFFGLGAEEGK